MLGCNRFSKHMVVGHLTFSLHLRGTNSCDKFKFLTPLLIKPLEQCRTLSITWQHLHQKSCHYIILADPTSESSWCGTGLGQRKPGQGGGGDLDLHEECLGPVTHSELI